MRGRSGEAFRGSGSAGRRLLVVAILSLSSALSLLAAPAVAELRFRERSLPIAERKLFDIGIADRLSDGGLDVYTVNHMYPASWLERTRGWRFEDRTAAIGLEQDPAVPGWERILTPDPPERGPGLYAYIEFGTGPGLASGFRVVLEARGVPADGTLTLDPARRHEVIETDSATVKTVRRDGIDRVGFAIGADGRAVIRVAHPDMPVGIESAAPSSADLYLGAEALADPDRTAVVSLRDRHGYALGELTGDIAEDLFAVVGGLGGDIAQAPFRGRVFDEVLAGSAAGFTPALTPPKDDCRGRQAEVVDVDADGTAELFSSCELALPIVLRRQGAAYERLVVPGAHGSTYRWVAADRDPRPELLVAGLGPARLIQLTSDGFVEQARAPLLSGDAPVRSLSVADYDGDGDTDFFSASPSGNTLLVGDGHGGIRARDPVALNLPARSDTATWVDVDLDGRLDLHALPQGVFARRGPARFRATGELRAPPGSHAIANWADLNGDGLRDAVYAAGPYLQAARHEVEVRENLTDPRGRWLAVDLPGALQTARVTVRDGSRTRVGWAGAADDSPFSQTHNRVYFGLGKRRTAGRVLRVRVSGAGLEPIRIRTLPGRTIAPLTTNAGH